VIHSTIAIDLGENMNSKLRLMLLMWLVLIGTAHADTLDQIKKDGVLVVGVRNGMRPFGFIDKAKMELVGYDVDFARAIAGKLGVKLQLKSSDAKSPDAPLIPLLLERKVDLIAGAMTKSAERMKQIDFSLTYYVTGQTFLVKKGTVKAVSDLAGKTIGTTRKSTAIDNLKNVLPGITIVRFSNYREAFTALKMGGISAVCTDATILEGLLAADPQKAAYEILDARISSESYGLGVRKGDRKLLDFVDRTLLELEQSGEAAKIYDKWFGKDSEFYTKRAFTITADK